ncbi:Fibronectin type 3 and ankyrin repeat domains protein 1 [Thoreauomyces humboldtii]|nr:Fibronectin type 3 and ankyrin repeat domains protein 1 [Thoreauomyces humboldtii]
MVTAPIPAPKITSSAARSLTLQWTPLDPDEHLHNVGPITYQFPWRYQLSRAEGDDPDHQVVYEGSDSTHEILDLKPETRYMIKLRIQEDESLGGEWSRDYLEIEGKTTDETLSQRLTSQLFRAVANNDAVTVQRCVTNFAKEVSLETRDRFGKTPLMNACQTASQDVVSVLLKAGASTSAATLAGKTALSLAATHGNLEAVQAILSQSSTTVDIPDQGGSTPLMWAAENVSPRHPDGLAIVQYILDHGATVDVEDARQQTALDRLCATSGDASAGRALLLKGARIVNAVDKANNQTMTTLMVAALNGHKDLCVELMDRWEADPAVATEFGGTARSFALQAGHRDVVEELDTRLAEARKRVVS